jgi:hypothetical protein
MSIAESETAVRKAQVTHARVLHRKLIAMLHILEFNFEITIDWDDNGVVDVIDPPPAAKKPKERDEAVFGKVKLTSSTPAPTKTNKSPKKTAKGKRVDAQTKLAVEDALMAGELGSHVAKKFGISYPTLHTIKQRLGLVNARK